MMGARGLWREACDRVERHKPRQGRRFMAIGTPFFQDLLHAPD